MSGVAAVYSVYFLSLGESQKVFFYARRKQRVYKIGSEADFTYIPAIAIDFSASSPLVRKTIFRWDESTLLFSRKKNLSTPYC